MIDLLTHEFVFRVAIPGWLEIDDAKAAIERVREVAIPTVNNLLADGSFDFIVPGSILSSLQGEDTKARDNVEAAFALGALIWDLNVELQAIDSGIEIEPVS